MNHIMTIGIDEDNMIINSEHFDCYPYFDTNCELIFVNCPIYVPSNLQHDSEIDNIEQFLLETVINFDQETDIGVEACNEFLMFEQFLNLLTYNEYKPKLIQHYQNNTKLLSIIF